MTDHEVDWPAWLKDLAYDCMEGARAHEREAYRLRKLADRMLFPEPGTQIEYGGRNVVRFVSEVKS